MGEAKAKDCVSGSYFREDRDDLVSFYFTIIYLSFLQHARFPPPPHWAKVESESGVERKRLFAICDDISARIWFHYYVISIYRVDRKHSLSHSRFSFSLFLQTTDSAAAAQSSRFCTRFRSNKKIFINKRRLRHHFFFSLVLPVLQIAEWSLE